MAARRSIPFLALLVAFIPPAAHAQARSQGNASPPPAATEQRPPSALQIQRDALSSAIVKGDAAKLAGFIRAGVALDFNLDFETRGRSSQSPLTMAVNLDRIAIVRMLLDAGADVRRKDGWGDNAIGAARSPEMVAFLIKRGADPNAPGMHDLTAVVKAAENGNFPVLDALLAGGASFDSPYRPPDIFTRVVEAKKPELIGRLLQRGADPKSPPTKALWPLIEKGDAANARLLIAAGADPNASNGREKLVPRALFRQQWEIAAALLDAGAPLNVQDAPGCERKIACESIEVVRFATFNPSLLASLKNRGIDLDTVSATGHTALTSLVVEQPMAIRAGSAGTAIGVAVGPGGQQVVTEMRRPVPGKEIPAPDNVARMKVLLDAGADPNRKFQQLTPLMLVAGSHGKPAAMVDVLIAAGGRIDFDGTIPPLKSSADTPQASALPPDGGGMLVAAGSLDRSFATGNYQGVLSGMRVGALGWAVLIGRPEIAQRLLKRDRRIDAADRNLVYFASSAGDWDLVLAALRHTREVNVANRADVTPLMLAARAGRPDVVRALLAAGAKVNDRSARIWPPITERNLRDEFGAAVAGHSPRPPALVGGFTALGAAKERGNVEVIRILTEGGGRE